MVVLGEEKILESNEILFALKVFSVYGRTDSMKKGIYWERVE
jgi:hypothetical protein